MILFKITACPTKSQVGNYQHESNQISFGNADADMVIDDPEISPKQIQISFNKGEFSIQNLNTKIAVKLNGTLLTGKAVPIKSNDNLVLGSTSVFFTRIDDKPLTVPTRKSDESIEARLSNEGTVEFAIAKALDYLAENSAEVPNVAPTTSPPPLPGVKK